MKLGLILFIICLNSRTFGQIMEENTFVKIENHHSTTSYLDALINVVGTNFNYGESNNELSDYKQPLLGLQVGASFQAGITPSFSIVSEMYLLMKGGGLKPENPMTTDKSNIRIYSLELPLLARFHLGQFHFNIGPSIAYNLYGSQKIAGSTSGLSFGNSNNDFQRWETGVQIGGGYTFNTKRKRLNFDIRYNYGITDISNGNNIYNRSLIVSLHSSKPWKKNSFNRDKKE
ncbi:outer membrane protein with beta-barrel domain [Gelidibacter algens]|uniref:Outer membrane protein with beta-barrel domain n=2 Tax=Gelidibacter algens TaxID=49280 RepID=A0A327SH78_9FLAO|nr:outer membrane protein with beta-barrel domain [Gelidibacter algens]